MRAILAAVIVAGAALSDAAASQVVVRTDSLYSPSLGRTTRFQMVLPEGYDSTRTYPLLWLLHGFGGDGSEWLVASRLEHYVRCYPLIVVLPDAGVSWYVNAISDAAARFEDYILRDLTDTVAARYPVDPDRQAIAGLSMGGYGALVLGLRHPARFRYVGGLSAALNVPRDIAGFDTIFPHGIPSLHRAFGEKPSDHWVRHDPFVLFRQTPAAALPFIDVAIGTADRFPSLVVRNREFADSLRAHGARYIYTEQPADHDWLFWDTMVPDLLAQVWQVVTAVDM
jgi:S-formylglutathione hydrolase FrmB